MSATGFQRRRRNIELGLSSQIKPKKEEPKQIRTVTTDYDNMKFGELTKLAKEKDPNCNLFGKKKVEVIAFLRGEEL